MRVPGSIQGALRDAGLIPDWNRNLAARAAEWVENRHWILQATLPDALFDHGRHHRLLCRSLDGNGRILINRQELCRFDNGFTPYELTLDALLAESNNTIQIVFECPERWLGQFGRTSEMRSWKARFNYFWDWTSRLLQIGIGDEILIESGDERFYDLRLRSCCDDQLQAPSIHLAASLDCDIDRDICVSLSSADGACLYNENFPAHLLKGRGHRLDLSGIRDALQLWYPNGLGKQPLYDIAIKLVDAADPERVFQCEQRRIGFRSVSWQQNPGCRRDADSWWCHVNGQGLFLQGVNWTPIRPNWADVDADHYRRLLTTYRDLGFNLLRVWGGATLERQCFYDLCDELGLMVWQEFPLSSSGVDNCPPDDPAAVLALGDIARSYIVQRMHHACHIVWCGGNELRKTRNCNTPIDFSHPVMQQFQLLVDQLDPDKRFVTSTPSGPSFGASAADYGKGVHWAVNGPWRHGGRLEDGWYRYWDDDDSLLRSETGLAGPSSATLIRHYNDADAVYPCSTNNPLWRRHPWWVEWDQCTAELGHEAGSLEEYVNWGQERQRLGLAHAVTRSKERYPACGGFIIWMGHDSFPCCANTSIIDFDGELKPAAKAIGEIFHRPLPSP